MEITDLMKQKKRNCISRRYSSPFDPWLILHPLTDGAYLLSSMDYDCKKMGPRGIQDKISRVRHEEKLEDRFGGTQNDIGSFKGFADFQYTA
jgi:hypothetical protein